MRSGGPLWPAVKLLLGLENVTLEGGPQIPDANVSPGREVPQGPLRVQPFSPALSRDSPSSFHPVIPYLPFLPLFLGEKG